MISNLYRLKYIIRYSNYKRITNEDVAQHSFYVSTICVELHGHYPKADLGRMLLMATVHDWPEAEIDDVSHKVKKDFPGVAKALKEAEREVIEQYPGRVREAFIEYEEQNTIEAKLVKLADTVQCIQYLQTEEELGNKSLASLLQESNELYFKLQEEVNDYYQRFD